MLYSANPFRAVPIGGCRSRRQDGGFSLIELLVVIAIIIILAAILFPVFSSLQETAREGSTMSHMHDISAGLALYKLDNKSYPPVLFAYACDGNASAVDTCNTADTMATIGSDPEATHELVGLYPEYVRDWHTFTCDSDLINDGNGHFYTNSASVPQAPQPNYLGATDYQLHPAGYNGDTTDYPLRSYFTKDAFDINPEVAGDKELVGGVNNYVYVIRYQTSWTSFCYGYDPSKVTSTSVSPCDANYPRQLRWANPPANTYVTAVTQHVATANKLIVLYESGTAQKAELSFNMTGLPTNGDWVEPAGTPPTIAPVAVSGCTTFNASGSQCDTSNAVFWQYDKNQ
jgi:prepilin-type N-terminal cleavage/methylation domain-containing protein